MFVGSVYFASSGKNTFADFCLEVNMNWCKWWYEKFGMHDLLS